MLVCDKISQLSQAAKRYQQPKKTNCVDTVIFDTNSYRQLAAGKNNVQLHNKVDEILKLEKSKGLRAYVANVVGMELMANLAEGEKGVNYSDCLNALIALSRHCYEISTNLSRLIPPPIFHLADNIFGIMPITYNQQWLNISNLYNQFQINNGAPKDFFTKENFYEDLKSRTIKSEEDFSNNIINLIESARQNIIEEKPNLPHKVVRTRLISYLKSERFEQIFALKLLSDTARELGIQPTYSQLMDMASYVCHKLPLTIGFFKWITSKIVENNINMKSKNSREKRWNWLWDYQLTFLMSENTIDSGQIILVTSDTDIKEMLEDFGFKHKVMDFQGYLNYLNS